MHEASHVASFARFGAAGFNPRGGAREPWFRRWTHGGAPWASWWCACNADVERCWRTKKALEEQSGTAGERLLPENSVGAAVPLGEFGVLYAGRQAPKPFSGPENSMGKTSRINLAH